jgi:hypothetical protein
VIMAPIPAGLLATGTLGKFGVDCPQTSLDRHVRRGTRANQAEVRLEFTPGALKLGRGEMPDIVGADHVIYRKQ